MCLTWTDARSYFCKSPYLGYRKGRNWFPGLLVTSNFTRLKIRHRERETLRQSTSGIFCLSSSCGNMDCEYRRCSYRGENTRTQQQGPCYTIVPNQPGEDLSKACTWKPWLHSLIKPKWDLITCSCPCGHTHTHTRSNWQTRRPSQGWRRGRRTLFTTGNEVFVTEARI